MSQSKKASGFDLQVAAAMLYRRKELGLSQIEVAKALGLTFQQVQKYERGANRIAAGRLAEIAQLFQVPVGYFFKGQDAGAEEAAQQARPELLATPAAIDLLRSYSRIETPTARRAVLNVVRALAAKR